MPTDEKFIEWLRKIKEYCESCDRCSKCKFLGNDTDRMCIFSAIADLLSELPQNWEMEEIERIIKL